MGNRRMISRSITQSLQFISMSTSAQALYMHIVINSDDDGVCETGVVLRVTRIRRKALAELIDNGFVTMLIPDKDIVYTNDWQTFNHNDVRYGQASIYRETLLKHFPTLNPQPFQGKNASPHTSDTRKSEVKSSLSEENRSLSEVKSNEEPPSGCDANNKPTDDLEGLTPTSYVFTEGVPRDISEITDFLRLFVFYDDSTDTSAQLEAEKFYRLNENYGWKNVRKQGLRIVLVGYINADKKLRPRFEAWSPSLVAVVDLFEARKQKKMQHDVDILMRRHDFEELQAYYSFAERIRLEWVKEQDASEIAANMIERYGYPPYAKLKQACEARKKENRECEIEIYDSRNWIDSEFFPELRELYIRAKNFSPDALTDMEIADALEKEYGCSYGFALWEMRKIDNELPTNQEEFMTDDEYEPLPFE